jgi:Pregnancy-associated plasma protein-A
MKKALLLIFLSVSSFLFSQIPCGTAGLMQSIDEAAYYERMDQLIRSGEAQRQQSQVSTLVIPVVFHVVYNTANQNVHDSLLYQQLTRLNEDFQRNNSDSVNTPASFLSVVGRMDIQFCLAQRTPTGTATNGILRISTNAASFSTPLSYSNPDPVKHTNLGGSDAWDTDSYLNIWICNLTGSTAYSAPPLNFMPADEGIVCDYRHVGNTQNYPYGLGRTIVHEAGHFFGLKHIWGDDQGACTGTDYMSDTPNQGTYSTNCPTFPLTDACSPNSPGVMFMNYMDYSEDGCRNMFSAAQVNYMLATITQFRSGFLTAIGCTPPSIGYAEEAISLFGIQQNANELTIQAVQGTIAEIVLYNMQGQLIQRIKANSESSVVLSLHGYSGMYCLQVSGADGSVSNFKFVCSN